MKKLFYTLLLVMAVNAAAFSQLWIQKASMYNYGRFSGIGCSLDGKGYVGLGEIYNNTYVNDFWQYDTISNIWINKANYPGAGLYQSICFVINGKIYVGLGFSNSHECQSDFWEYNQSNNTWIQKANFPGTARYGARSFVIGDSAFIVAGSYGDNNSFLSDMYMYIPATNTWKQKSTFAGGSRNQGTAFSINGMGYFGAGLANGSIEKKDFWNYNPTTNLWTAISDFPGVPRNAPVSFVINNKAYVGFGGNNISTIVYNDMSVYDPISNSWQTINIPADIVVRTGASAFSFGNNAYIAGGNNTTGMLTDLWSVSFNSIANSIVESKNDNMFIVYPNPANNNISIRSTSLKHNEKIHVSIYDIQRKLMLNRIAEHEYTEIDISGFAKGIYFVNIKTNDENTTRKFIKE